VVWQHYNDAIILTCARKSLLILQMSKIRHIYSIYFRCGCGHACDTLEGTEAEAWLVVVLLLAALALTRTVLAFLNFLRIRVWDQDGSRQCRKPEHNGKIPAILLLLYAAKTLYSIYCLAAQHSQKSQGWCQTLKCTTEMFLSFLSVLNYIYLM
jgi:hypothetical protein